MNQQIATTYSQSNKLIKCGIDINTADMFYTDAGGLKLMWENVIPKSEIKTPAWSIFALLNLIPHNEL